MKRAGIVEKDGKVHIRPEKRLVVDERGKKYVLTLREKSFSLKPFRAHSGELAMTWGAAYRKMVWHSAKPDRPPKRRVGRGLLKLEP